MRSVVTFVATWLFVLGFFGFVAVSAFVGYARDTDAVVDTARSADMRGRSVALTTELVMQELAREPSLAQVPQARVQAIVSDVISPDWFEQTLGQTHRGLVAAVDGAADTAVVELEPTKDALRRGFGQLKQRVRNECVKLLGPTLCRNDTQAMRAVDAYGRRANAAIARIPEQIDILAGMQDTLDQRAGRAGPINTQVLRQRLGDLHWVRWIGLGLLISCLLLIAILNGRSWGRTMRATGRAVALAGLVYLGVGKLLAWAGPSFVTAQVEHLRAASPAPARVDEIITGGVETLAVAIPVDALARASELVIVCLVVGVLLWLGGVILGGR